jgi:hypothetical protein
LGGSLNLLGIGHVGRQHERLAACCLNLLAGALEPIFIAGEQPYVSPVLSESFGRRPSDTRRCACNDDYLRSTISIHADFSSVLGFNLVTVVPAAQQTGNFLS